MENDNTNESMTPTGLYRHFKGSTYAVVGEGTHTETGEIFVIYIGLSNKGRFYCRPKDLFNGYTDNGEKRFVKIS